jgi:aminopeptidase-like protein
MYALMEELYPICRSITGPGLRRTLGILGERIPLQVHEVPTGTRVFDWTIPKEWSIRDAFIADAAGRRVVDFRESNLHVVNYSVPVDEQMPLEALRAHIHTLPEHPDWIPYRTSYYRETWGFCMRHADLERLPPGTYHARIDSTLAPGHLSYGELLVPGEDRREVLISTHVCHPSLCNDNLSGMVLATALARCLRDAHLRWSYRFVFIPGGIGSVAWLAANEDRTRNIHAGLVVTCVGDDGPFTYKQSRRGDAEIDRAAAQVLRDAGVEHSITPFSPYGYDERNYGSPGFNLPVGSLSRSSFGRFPQYHTSADDLSLVGPDSLAASLDMYLRVIQVLEGNRVFLSRQPKGEVQLGRRGLYGGMGGLQRRPSFELPLLWVLNLSDGEHSLLDVAERSGLPFEDIHAAAERLRQHELLQPLT